jgi:hypothetical protein
MFSPAGAGERPAEWVRQAVLHAAPSVCAEIGFNVGDGDEFGCGFGIHMRVEGFRHTPCLAYAAIRNR